MEYYTLEVAGLIRQLPIIPISKDLSIASFVLLGDQEMVTKAAQELNTKLPEVDVFVTAEAKGIPLINELARLRNMPRYVVARKSVKVYMENPLYVEVDSITTANPQKLYLDEEDIAKVKGKKVAIVDDVISTGESLRALEKLVIKAEGIVKSRAAILAEGDAAKRTDIIFLKDLPLFQNKPI